MVRIAKRLTPQINKRYEQAMFNISKEEDDESYSKYFDRLKTLIKNCQYGQIENYILLDRNFTR